jgi:tetratricopeptide (TPR) repeat protein
MVSCRQCATLNTLDSAYCRKCGVALPAEDIAESQAKLDALVAEGVTSFNEGRTDEALAIAERALDSNPTMVLALSLASDVFVRRGDLATALDYADKVVELNPDSDLDRIRRNQLRTRIQSEIRVSEPDRRSAMVAAVAAVVFVGCIGAIGAKFLSQPKPEEKTGVVANLSPGTNLVNPAGTLGAANTNPATGANPAASGTGAGNGNPNNNQNTGAGDSTNADRGDETSNAGYTDRRRNEASQFPLPRYNGGTLPAVGPTEITPIRPQPPEGGGVDPAPQPEGNQTGERGKVKTDLVKSADPLTKPPEPEPDPGEITISVRKSGTPSPRVNNSAGGSVPVTNAEPISGAGVQALLRSASQQFQAGNLSASATTYERALANGADPISTNQRLGMVYERLGRNGEAINAYNRVIQAAQNALSTGTGNASRVQSALDTAKQAVRALGG